MKKINRFGLSLLKEKYYTQSDLIKRGWTLKQIVEQLSEPTLFENPTNTNFSPIKCWKKKIVKQKEKLRKVV